MTNRKRFQTPLFFLLFLLLTPAALGQSPWLDQTAGRVIWLEVLKPNHSEGFSSLDTKTPFLASNWYLSARWQAVGLLVLRTEIPFVNAGFKLSIDTGGGSINYNYSENQFGNPYLGVELGRPGASSFGEIGIRFPVVDNEHLFSSEFGTYTDYDRFDAFVPNTWTFTAAAKVQLKSREGILLLIRAGPAFFLPTEGGVDPELFGDYSLQTGYQSSRITLLGGFTGRGWLTENDLSNRFIDQFGFSASYVAGNFVPGVQLRLPMDVVLSDIVDFVFGLNLGYRLP